MKRETTKDMTSGSPLRLILAFAVPVLLSSLFQQVYNVADTAIVSKTLGEQALAAVGSIGSVNFLILGFCNAMGMGFAVPIAQCFGARDMTTLRKYVGNAVWLFAMISAVVTAVSVALCMPILRATQTPGDIIGMAYDYLLVIFLGIPVSFAYNALAGIIRSLGDSKTPPTSSSPPLSSISAWISCSSSPSTWGLWAQRWPRCSPNCSPSWAACGSSQSASQPCISAKAT